MLDQQEWDVIECELTRFLVGASIQYGDFFLVDYVVYQVRAIARRFHDPSEQSLLDFGKRVGLHLVRLYTGEWLLEGEFAASMPAEMPECNGAGDRHPPGKAVPEGQTAKRRKRRHEDEEEGTFELRTPESSVPSWVPKTEKARARWREVYQVIDDLRTEYYLRSLDERGLPARPTMSDIKIALAALLIRQELEHLGFLQPLAQGRSAQVREPLSEQSQEVRDD